MVPPYLTLFRVAKFDHLNRDNYYTLSRHGCTHMVANDEIEHISLERFEVEYKTFVEICKVVFCLVVFLSVMNLLNYIKRSIAFSSHSAFKSWRSILPTSKYLNAVV